MTGLVFALQEGENTITILVADGVAKSQHIRDLYLVSVDDCKHEYTEIERVDPTCTTAGYVTKVCGLCEKTVTKKITFVHDIQYGICTICGYRPPCETHDYGNRFEKKWGICVVCGYVDDNHEHAIVDGKCAYCDYEFEAIAVPSTFDNNGDGVNDVFYFSAALPEEFTGEDVIWLDAFNDSTGSHMEYDEIRANSGNIPYPHVYCADKNTTHSITFTFNVETEGLYNVAVHYRIKDQKVRGATFVVNGTQVINHTYGWATADEAYEVRNNDFLIGAYMTGLVFELQEGENTISIIVVDGVDKSQHIRDLYLVPNQYAKCEHNETIDSAVAPTCTETGLTEGKHCDVCNEVLVPQEIVPMASHEWKAKYGWDKGVHWQICSACDGTNSQVAHTVGADGYCTVCDNPIAGSDGVLYWPSSSGAYAEVIDYVGDSARVVIAEEYEGLPVTHISHNAFENKNISSIVLPSSITNIGESAFARCSAMQSISIPASVTEIASGAFSNCSNLSAVYINNLLNWCNISFGNYYANPLYYAHNLYLEGALVKNLVIPAEITSVKSYTFAGGSCFDAITIHNNVTTIGKDAFLNCSNLKSATLPLFALSNIPKSKLVSVVITNGTIIFSSVLQNCYYLESVTLADTITNIGERAFSGCSKLKTINFPEGLTTIGANAFNGCSNLETINFPKGLTTIGANAFKDCSKLIETINGVSYIADCLIGFDNSSALISVREGTKIIADSAFSDCSKLRILTISNTVTSIGYSAFRNCTSLSSITIPDSVTSIGSYAFFGCTNLVYNEYENGCYLGNDTNEYLVLVKMKDTTVDSATIYENTKVINYEAFSGCSNLTSITIPNNVTSIGGYAFYNCSSLTSITIPGSVTSIGEWTFARCSNLTDITIPDSITMIGEYAFVHCESHNKITFKGTIEQWNSIKFGACWHNYCPVAEVICSNGSISLERIEGV